ncbi:MAG TPA: hypothetical protein VFB60_05875 [Ktedonobacteraceae bacterium]|nr:hypothetical protein [Ktedonobacteraceae bacterium]
MLHQIELPTYDGKLDRIVEFQQQFIAILCTSSISLCPQEDDFKQAFADDQCGAWTFTWLQKKSKKGTYYEELCKLLIYFAANPGSRQLLVDAFKNDADFYAHKDDAQFKFLFNTGFNTKKYTELSSIVKSLMIAFYEKLFSDGFPPYVADIDRKRFLKIFWDTNKKLGVCPACDGQRPDMDDRCDIDHFFPKALYPFLSMRAANLVPICVECNRVYKKDKDPLDHSLPAPLINTFHPYGRPAINEIKIVVYREVNGERKVLLKEPDDTISPRIKQMNHVLELEKRWNERLKRVIGNIEQQVRRSANKRRKEGINLTAIVEDVLRDKADNADIGKEPNSVITGSYVDYVLLDLEERLTLAGQIIAEDNVEEVGIFEEQMSAVLAITKPEKDISR